MPEKRIQIGKLVEADPSILHKPLAIQIQNLIVPLFTPMPPNAIQTDFSPLYAQPRHVIIIDGLDECNGENSQRDIIEHIGKLANTNCIPLRFVITSRPELHIEESFGHLVGTFHRISLAEHDASQARDDTDMAQSKNLGY